MHSVAVHSDCILELASDKSIAMSFHIRRHKISVASKGCLFGEKVRVEGVETASAGLELTL